MYGRSWKRRSQKKDSWKLQYKHKQMQKNLYNNLEEEGLAAVLMFSEK